MRQIRRHGAGTISKLRKDRQGCRWQVLFVFGMAAAGGGMTIYLGVAGDMYRYSPITEMNQFGLTTRGLANFSNPAADKLAASAMASTLSKNTTARTDDIEKTIEENRLNLLKSESPKSITSNKTDIPEKNGWKLRYEWSNPDSYSHLMSPLARRMAQHQNNCNIPLANAIYRNRYGLGSDLHVWGQALLNGMESGLRLRTVPPWTWMDKKSCGNQNSEEDSTMLSAMTCYFPSSELNCRADAKVASEHWDLDNATFPALSGPKGQVLKRSYSISEEFATSKVREAATEFLFHHVSPLVVREAERQMELVFGSHGSVPPGLITVHMRWGDKRKEMKLVDAKEYVDAVLSIESRRLAERDAEGGAPDDDTETVHVYLATEDPSAVRSFTMRAPNHWKVYVDQYFHDVLPQRKKYGNDYNGNPKMAKESDGRLGLIALGSILVALEADDFVLTTASNWSRLLDEIRRTILEARCQETRQRKEGTDGLSHQSCTSSIDLRAEKNEW